MCEKCKKNLRPATLALGMPKTARDDIELVLDHGKGLIGAPLTADMAERIAGYLLDAARRKRQLDHAAEKGLDALRSAARPHE